MKSFIGAVNCSLLGRINNIDCVHKETNSVFVYEIINNNISNNIKL